MEKKTGNLGCFVCPLPVFFSLNYQPFLATLPRFSDFQVFRFSGFQVLRFKKGYPISSKESILVSSSILRLSMIYFWRSGGFLPPI